MFRLVSVNGESQQTVDSAADAVANGNVDETGDSRHVNSDDDGRQWQQHRDDNKFGDVDSDDSRPSHHHDDRHDDDDDNAAETADGDHDDTAAAAAVSSLVMYSLHSVVLYLSPQ